MKLNYAIGFVADMARPHAGAQHGGSLLCRFEEDGFCFYELCEGKFE
jgi:hypothetical protein